MKQQEANKLARQIIAGLIQNFIDIGAVYDGWTDNDADAGRLNKALEKHQLNFGRGEYFPRIGAK